MTRIFSSTALLADGWKQNVVLTIEQGSIADIAENGRPEGCDERYDVLLPAMGNLHSHAFQRAMAGLAERRGTGDDSFWSWRDVMYKFALSMSPDDVEAVAAQLYVEMLEAGYGRVGEFHYLHHDRDGSPYGNVAEMAERIAAASVAAGIGLTMLPVFYAHSGFGPKPASQGQRRFVNDIDRFGEIVAATTGIVGRIPGANFGVAPHSLRAATLDEIRRVVELSGGGPVHIHVAEQVLEVEDCLAATGLRPVRYLLDNLPVDERWCLIHATHLDDGEVKDMAASGAVAGLCPITEANLGDGIFRGAGFVAAGGRFGVGTDSNVQVSLAGELRQFEYSQRLRDRARNVIAAPGGSTALELCRLAAAGAGRALAADAGLAAGGSADFLSLDVGATPYLRHEDQLDAFVFGSDVHVGDVWVAGRRQVVGGRHVKRDAIRKTFETAMARLLDA